MQTVILAAGEGTRMRPLTETVPKPMLPVADRPLVAHVADAAVQAGSTELIFVVGYQGQEVREYFGDAYRTVPVRYVRQGEQRGTAHALRAAKDEIEGPFVVLNGDNLFDQPAIDALFESEPAILVKEVAEPSNYGVVSIEDEQVTSIIEKPVDPPTSFANAGGYALPEATSDWLDVPVSERGEQELTDVIARVIDEYTVTPVTLEKWMDVGRPWELLEANEWKLGEMDRSIDGEVSEAATIRGPVVVEPGAVIEPGVVIEGPALVRSGADVGPNAYVRGHTVLGENVHVGASVEVKNSVVMDGTNLPHLTYLGDSVIGRNVNFGAGTTVANLRHDDEPIRFTVKGERVSTGRKKFGVVVADGVKTGINTTLNAGVTLGVDARTGPDETVLRDR